MLYASSWSAAVAFAPHQGHLRRCVSVSAADDAFVEAADGDASPAHVPYEHEPYEHEPYEIELFSQLCPASSKQRVGPYNVFQSQKMAVCRRHVAVVRSRLFAARLNVRVPGVPGVHFDHWLKGG